MISNFRDFIETARRCGELRVVEGADVDLEIGTLTELVAEKGGPLLLFDRIKDSLPGYRVAVNCYLTPKRTALALGLPSTLTAFEIIKNWREKVRHPDPVQPVQVDRGPILENICKNGEVDLLQFPVPKWHERDGGRYFGTGCVVITQDPDEGWTNLAPYRVQIHGKAKAGINVGPAHHGKMMMHKYWARGKSCPIAVATGVAPSIFVAASYSLPWGFSEYQFAGHIGEKPVEVIKDPSTGLAVPADSEIVILGEVPPPEQESEVEGPFGEYTGYFGGIPRPEPVIKIRSVMFRNNPILQGEPSLRPPWGEHFGAPILNSPAVWNRLDAMGIPGVVGVYTLDAGAHGVIAVSIKQSYAGHAKQTAMGVASSFFGSNARFIVVVDDDIDPSDPNAVLWAMATRCDPVEDVDVVKNYHSGPLDPRLSPEKKKRGDYTKSIVIVSACRPFAWAKDYPPVNKASDELRSKYSEKWKDLLGEISSR